MVQKLILLATGLAVGIIAGWFLKTQAIEAEQRPTIEKSCAQLMVVTRTSMRDAEAAYLGEIESPKAPTQQSIDDDTDLRGQVRIMTSSSKRAPADQLRSAQLTISSIGAICGKAKQLKLQNEMDALIKRHPAIMKNRPTE